MKWFIVVYLLGSDDILVKEMNSKQECMKEQKEFKKKVINRFKEIQDITCEEGEIMNTISRKKEDELL